MMPLQKKKTGTIAKSILELVVSSKSATCDVSILNILIRKEKHQRKAREIKSYLQEPCKEFNILIMRKVLKHNT